MKIAAKLVCIQDDILLYKEKYNKLVYNLEQLNKLARDLNNSYVKSFNKENYSYFNNINDLVSYRLELTDNLIKCNEKINVLSKDLNFINNRLIELYNDYVNHKILLNK